MKVFLIAALVFLSGGAALACSCGPKPPPLKAMEEADAVFFGTVSKIEEKQVPTDYDREQRTIPKVAVTFSVEAGFKGDFSEKTVTVFTGNGGGDCGFLFEEGGKYLVYAFQTKFGFGTDICTRTRKAEADSKEVLELGHRLPALKEGRPLSLSVKGRVTDPDFEGFSFTFDNGSKDRLFFLGEAVLLQKLVKGKWLDCVPVLPFGADLSDEEGLRKEAVSQGKLEYSRLSNRHYFRYASSGESRSVFVKDQSAKYPWRIGIQYLTETEFYSGKTIQKSDSILWSDPVIADESFRVFTFEEVIGAPSE